MLAVRVFPRKRWPLTVYEVAISKVEKLEKVMNKTVRKWLGVPRYVSTVALYGKVILELPITSLVEKFKCVAMGSPQPIAQGI